MYISISDGDPNFRIKHTHFSQKIHIFKFTCILIFEIRVLLGTIAHLPQSTIDK